jgi:hypothetical protein
VARTKVYLEVGNKKVFACAADWPGWCRSGKDADAALEALAEYAPRYAPVAKKAGLDSPADHSFDVAEQVKGNATTEFGAPGVVPKLDARRLTTEQAERQADLVQAAWKEFDRILKKTPASLRKGPRGGGRDRDKMASHVLDAEQAYARKFDIKHKAAPLGDAKAIAANRTEILEALRAARAGDAPYDKGWPPRYVARRIAWHVLDHAWEMQDRSSS